MLNKKSEDPLTANIYSDASNTGCGAHFQGRNTGSNWSLEEKYNPINIKEMLVAYLSLKYFANDFSNLTLKIHTDNTAMVSILKTWVNPTFHCLTKNVSLYVWEWCKSENIWLFPIYVNTKHNLADEPSRKI